MNIAAAHKTIIDILSQVNGIDDQDLTRAEKNIRQLATDYLETNRINPSTDNVLPTVTPAQVKQVYSFPHVILAKIINGQVPPTEIKEFVLTELKVK